MRWSLKIATLGGTVIRLHLTFLLFLLWIATTDLLAGGLSALMLGLPFVLLIFLSVLVHEFAHVRTARRFGVATADVTLLPIGGVSRMSFMPHRPKEEMLIALAGPAASLILGVALILLGGGLTMPTPAHPMVEINFWASLGVANIVLGLFNLLPAFPMDGGRVLRAALTRWRGRAAATRIAASSGQILAILFAFAGLAGGDALLVFVGLFVYIAAAAESGAVQVEETISGSLAADVMVTHELGLQSGQTIADAAEALVRTSQHEFPILDETGRLLGLLTRDTIVQAIATSGGEAPVEQAMTAPVPLVRSGGPALEALKLLEEGAPAVGVEDQNGQFAGLVTLDNLTELLLLKRAAERRRSAAAPLQPA